MSVEFKGQLKPGRMARIAIVATVGVFLIYAVISVLGLQGSRYRLIVALYLGIITFGLVLTSVISGFIALFIRSGSVRLRVAVVVCLLLDVGLVLVERG